MSDAPEMVGDPSGNGKVQDTPRRVRCAGRSRLRLAGSVRTADPAGDEDLLSRASGFRNLVSSKQRGLSVKTFVTGILGGGRSPRAWLAAALVVCGAAE